MLYLANKQVTSSPSGLVDKLGRNEGCADGTAEIDGASDGCSVGDPVDGEVEIDGASVGFSVGDPEIEGACDDWMLGTDDTEG